MKALKEFHDGVTLLLKECFEGMRAGANSTWFVQGKEGLFDALSLVNAEQASRPLGQGLPTIAGHAFHVRYALNWANVCHGEERPLGNWEASWNVQTVNDEEWKALVEDIHARYWRYLAFYEVNEDWTFDEAIVSTLAFLPHMAYHLGALRQLVKLVRDEAA